MVSWATDAAVTLILVALAHAALKALNAFVMQRLVGAGMLASARQLGLAAGFLLAMLVARFVAARRGRGRFVGAVALLYVLAGYALDLRDMRSRSGPFGVAMTPNSEFWEDGRSRRGRHLYRHNAFGLRGGAWSLEKPPDTVRGIVIGDSMVYGSGVDEEDTLPALLRRRLEAGRPGGRIEVLNLGIPGANLAGYVRALDTATRLANPDFVVVCLFLPNDLGSFEQPTLAAQVGTYTFVKFLLGTPDNPYSFSAIRSGEPRGNAAPAILATRVRELREASRGVPLVFFPYSEADPRWVETTRAAAGEGALLATHPPFPDDCFIPGDGHPTAIGNRRFAEVIAEAIERSPAGALVTGAR
jgi:hypothetical protein